MLRVNMEIVPFGEEERKYSIGVMEIGNIGSQNDVANYVVQLDGNDIGKIEDFRRDRGAWDLVRLAIELLPQENRKGLHYEDQNAPRFSFKEFMDLQELIETKVKK
ncbi:hypothetical protein [Pseudodesulfovibrio pelocollis]|uniref:hypothetical protein n=1 Tax=Pseudodesulfovibrio pelocollis TaxID=3051432 RepID=UPI00255B2148|nr:hypothetical protein [Pseudodesulfovibrio sp. SB368]